MGIGRAHCSANRRHVSSNISFCTLVDSNSLHSRPPSVSSNAFRIAVKPCASDGRQPSSCVPSLPIAPLGAYQYSRKNSLVTQRNPSASDIGAPQTLRRTRARTPATVISEMRAYKRARSQSPARRGVDRIRIASSTARLSIAQVVGIPRRTSECPNSASQPHDACEMKPT